MKVKNILQSLVVFVIVLCSMTQLSFVKKDSIKQVSPCDTLSLVISCHEEGDFWCAMSLADRIEFLEHHTGIKSNAEFGFEGCFYLSDSLFYSDIKKWKDKLNCPN